MKNYKYITKNKNILIQAEQQYIDSSDKDNNKFDICSAQSCFLSDRSNRNKNSSPRGNQQLAQLCFVDVNEGDNDNNESIFYEMSCI